MTGRRVTCLENPEIETSEKGTNNTHRKPKVSTFRAVVRRSAIHRDGHGGRNNRRRYNEPKREASGLRWTRPQLCPPKLKLTEI